MTTTQPLPLAHVLDLDGTISDDRWRQGYLPEQPVADPLAYDDYHCGCDLDGPFNVALIERVPCGTHLIYLTSRPEKWRAATEAWLAKNTRRPYTALYMRPDGNMQPSPKFKADWLALYITPHYRVQRLVDDRLDVLEEAARRFGDLIGAYHHVQPIKSTHRHLAPLPIHHTNRSENQ